MFTKIIAIILLLSMNLQEILIVGEALAPSDVYAVEVECTVTNTSQRIVTLGMDFVKDDKAYCYLTKPDGTCHQNVWEMDILSDVHQCQGVIDNYINQNISLFQPQDNATFISKQWKDGSVTACRNGYDRVQKVIELTWEVPSGEVEAICPYEGKTCYQKSDGKYYCSDDASTPFCMKDLDGDGNIAADEYSLCTTDGVCPLGYSVCSSSKVCPLGNYPCVNNSCTQTGVCSSIQVATTQYQCPSTSNLYSDLATCNNNCMQTANCTIQKCKVTWIGNEDIFCEEQPGNWCFGGSRPDTIIFDVYFDMNCNVLSYKAFYPICNPSMEECWASHFWGYFCAAGTECLSCSNFFCGWGCLNLPCSSVIYNAPSYSCPLPDGSSCSGNPPTCSVGQSCITHNSTITKYQCSLTGTQYDTQDQCTSACSNTATCNDRYDCPLGSQYECKSFNNQMVCNNAQCMSNSQFNTQTEDNPVVDNSPKNDGQVDPNTGQCLGSLYIFPGKVQSCRKAGLKTGFKNCCNKGNKIGGGGSVLMSGISYLNTAKTIYNAASVAVEAYKAYRVVAFGTFQSVTTAGGVTTLTTQGGLTWSYSTTAYTAATQAVSAGTGAVGAATTAFQNSLLNALIPSPTAIAVMVAAFIITEIFMKGCNQEDIITSSYNQMGLCHYIGSKCVSKLRLIGCVQKADVFCCFNTKLGRIIHEGGRPQIGMGWGSAESPSCRGVTPEELQMIDFGKIDFSEYLADVTNDAGDAANAAISNIQNSVNSLRLR